MSKVKKYSEIFKTALNIGDDKLNENIKYNEMILNILYQWQTKFKHKAIRMITLILKWLNNLN